MDLKDQREQKEIKVLELYNLIVNYKLYNANVFIFKGFVGFPGAAGPPGLVTEGPSGLKGIETNIIQLLNIPFYIDLIGIFWFIYGFIIVKYSNKLL